MIVENLQYTKIKEHIGHKLTVANYGNGEEMAIECETCHQVLYTENEEEEIEDEPKKLPYDLKEKLIDTVIEELQKDVARGDYTAIAELLLFCPEENLIQYLPEEQWQEFEVPNSVDFILKEDEVKQK